MKKNLLALLVAVSFGAAGSVVAAPAAFQGNQDVAPADCPLLAETVTLGVSANVHGAFNCDETENLVQVAACHEGGSRAQGAACVDLDTTDGDDTGPLPAGCSEIGGFSTIPDYKAFFTSSKGGVMAEYALGGRCGAGTIVGIDGFE